MMNNDYNGSVQQEQPQQAQPIQNNRPVQGANDSNQSGGYPEQSYGQQYPQYGQYQQYRQNPQYQQPPYQQPPYQQYRYGQPQYQPPMPPQPGKGLATASLVCSIFSLVVSYTGPLAILGIILGIIAIVTAACAKKKGFVGGMATAGLVMGIIGTVISLIFFVSCLACIGAIGGGACTSVVDEWSDYNYDWDYYWDSYM
ncbi:MAG: DUF4190 domain-containing protein [Bacteroides sp.]|nr:DUF4190 domain-containing protein [Bacteroides sp.]